MAAEEAAGMAAEEEVGTEGEVEEATEGEVEEAMDVTGTAAMDPSMFTNKQHREDQVLQYISNVLLCEYTHRLVMYGSFFLVLYT